MSDVDVDVEHEWWLTAPGPTDGYIQNLTKLRHMVQKHSSRTSLHAAMNSPNYFNPILMATITSYE